MLAVHCQPALPYHIDYQLHHVRIHHPSSTSVLRLNRLNASAFDVPSGIPRALGTSQPLEPAYIISPSRPDCKPTARFQQQSSLCVPRASTFPECCPQYRTPLTLVSTPNSKDLRKKRASGSSFQGCTRPNPLINAENNKYFYKII